ncbi:MAG TPA: glycerol-3-phosphate acyltransferase, partial [Gemmatimonadales bacterium]
MPHGLVWLIASYLLGAVPTSHIVSRTIAGIDLRQHGSGNLGATNLYRVLGWRYAVPVALFDIAKGVIPVLVFAPQVSASELFAISCGVAAIIGHVFSIFVGFKGGKGVATAAGVMLALTPVALGVAALVWILVVRL